MISNKINTLFRHDAAGGVVLILAALLALILANSPLAHYYALLLDTPVEVRVGALQIAKPLLIWINDGLMAVFFFAIGLELKREILEGELSDKRAVMLPLYGAIGGMAVPAIIYLLINAEHPIAIQGWAIPTATDIAFALGILALLGKRVPIGLKTFLVSLAIFDDLGAIIIIATFYTQHISALSLLIAALCMLSLALFNRTKVSSLVPYLFIGLVMWVAVLKSGVHATLAGVALAMFIPLAPTEPKGRSLLHDLESDLQGFVTFGVVPIFAFANAGLSFSAMGYEHLLHPVTLGVALGLFVGKQLGVMSFTWLAVRTGIARLPSESSWSQLYGVAILCGIGFTMSLFIGSLAFENSGSNQLFDERLGILLASTLSAIVGYLWLNQALKKK